jgi:coenzyme PQQ synthesis protein D (PqqD)
MLSSHTRFRPNAEEVAADILDGEAVMINLSTGMYYSMAETGALVWALLDAGRSVEEIGAALARRYDVARDRADADVRLLLAKLVEENLVRVADRDAVGAADVDTPEAAGQPRLRYAAPELEIYRDVGHLVALDPPMPGLKDLPWQESGDDPSQRRSA